MSDVPLPEPWSYCYTFETKTSRHLSFSANKYNGMPPTEAVPIYTADQMHAYAAAVSAADNAALRERAKALEDALREYIDAADACVSGDDDVVAMLRFGEADKAAREALKGAKPDASQQEAS